MAQIILRLPMPGQGLHDITATVQSAVTTLLGGRAADSGLVTLFVQHTSASLLIQEHADPSARRDLERWLARLVPEDDPLYTHVTEGADDMPAHIRSMLTATSLGIPLSGGHLALGTWQGIYLFEHRHGAQQRRVVVQLTLD